MENNSNSGVIYQGKIPNRVKYCFAFGALGKDLIYGMIATFSMIYFTDIIKVAPAFIGSMFFVAKLWDAFNDLFMGMIVDNTRSRWGKFVPWLVIGTLINAFVFITVFTDFHLSGVSLCVFASVVYVLWGMTYTITKNFCQHRSVSYHRRLRCSDYQRTWRQLYWLPQIRINYRSNLYFYNGCLRYQPAKETAGYRNCRENEIQRYFHCNQKE